MVLRICDAPAFVNSQGVDRLSSASRQAVFYVLAVYYDTTTTSECQYKISKVKNRKGATRKRDAPHGVQNAAHVLRRHAANVAF